MRFSTIAACSIVFLHRGASADGPSSFRDGGNRALNGYFPCGTTTHCVKDRATCENDSVCVCLEGFSGPRCEPKNECEVDSPCPANSACSDHFPPELYKCECDAGTDAVLPDAADLTEPVPVDWRPIACIKPDPIVTGAPVTLSPFTAAPVTTIATTGSCSTDKDCEGSNFSKCNTDRGFCGCCSGFFKVGGNCQFENECRAGFPNVCHRNAICSNNANTPGYSCACAKGFFDVDTAAQAGTNCGQENECLLGTHDCPASKTCVDRVPPLKFDCIEPTPAPTAAPTPSPTAPRPLARPASKSKNRPTDCAKDE